MLNIKKLEKAIADEKFNKTKLCARTGIARTTLDAILNGSDARISTIETLSKVLNIKIGFLFDEDENIKVIQTEGDNSPASDSGDVSVIVGDAILSEQVKSLKLLVAEKDARISELKERILELKSQTNGRNNQ